MPRTVLPFICVCLFDCERNDEDKNIQVSVLKTKISLLFSVFVKRTKEYFE